MISKVVERWSVDIDFGELAEDSDFVTKCTNLQLYLSKVREAIEKIPKKDDFDKLPIEQQIEFDLFRCYTLNSMLWIHLRLKGVNMKNHALKRELERLKVAMARWKEIKERKFRPKVDVGAAKRFVRSGLYDHNLNSPPNKKRRFN